MYEKRITVAKTVVPSAIIVGGANVLQVVAGQAGIDIPDEKSYVIITAIYSAVRGFLNWLKNRRK